MRRDIAQELKKENWGSTGKEKKGREGEEEKKKRRSGGRGWQHVGVSCSVELQASCINISLTFGTNVRIRREMVWLVVRREV
eukprot:768173-Hanusia_phi.AAC.4